MNAPAQAGFGGWLARVLAVLAVAGATIAVIVVISGSLDTSGGEDGKAGKGPDRTQTQEKTAETYVVQPGDTLAGIAAEVGVPVERLEELNPEIDPQALPSGATLKLR